MKGLRLTLGLGTALSSVGGGGPAAPVPANYDFIVFGDSRFENGFNIGNTGAAGLTQSTSTIGLQSWLEIDSGYKLRLSSAPNFAIAASNTYQGSTIPRQNAVGAVTAGDAWRSIGAANFSDNKGAEYFNTHPAGFGVLLYGTNDQAVSDPQYLTTSRTNITTILDRAPSKVWVICNELPKGIKDDGTSGGQTVTANFKSYSDWLKTLDYASGHANARSNVIVVDTFAALVDPATGASQNNLRGVLWDGLHWAPGGARLGAAAVLSRLQSVWPWSGISPRINLPTTNGLTVLANAQPFINNNATMTPGTNGTVSGTWGTAPAAANIPQGWVVFATGSSSGFVCVADKTGTDDEGYPVLTLTISGTLATGAGGGSIWVYQNPAIATLFSGSLMTINDKFRAVGKCKVDAGSQYLAGVALGAILQCGAATAKYQTNKTASGPTVITAGAPAFIDTFASSSWMRYQTQVMDFQDPGKVALGENITAQADINTMWVRWEIDFRNQSGSTQNISAVIRFSRTGIQRV